MGEPADFSARLFHLRYSSISPCRTGVEENFSVSQGFGGKTRSEIKWLLLIRFRPAWRTELAGCLLLFSSRLPYAFTYAVSEVHIILSLEFEANRHPPNRDRRRDAQCIWYIHPFFCLPSKRNACVPLFHQTERRPLSSEGASGEREFPFLPPSRLPSTTSHFLQQWEERERDNSSLWGARLNQALVCGAGKP